MMWLSVSLRLLLQSIVKRHLFKERPHYTPEEEARAAERVKRFLTGEVSLADYGEANHYTPEEERKVKETLLRAWLKERGIEVD